ncbi:sodium-independent anion transporter [Croceivirga radicis]|uniref:Sodium-independent anion transporter n=1 Tax=Croceivirga radicis TaxID=1929488 RepID=A0A1V6LV30_9FLAO|nr:solute carrier family 26 protein [Croceivirga radicis]OQD44020.1 sodium-independent anion transporter [Croceivirga radicis]
MLKKYFPILDWLPNYKKSYLSGDLVAGLTVGVMLIPQGMAYAMIVGLPPVYGLYTALVPNLVYALTGTSRKLAVGPVALDALIVASGLSAMKLATEGEYIAMALFIALFVGVLQLAMGFLKLGFLANFLSRPVVSGFTSAAAIVIGVSQLKHLFGVKVSSSNTVETIQQLFTNLHTLNWYDFTIGVAAMLVIVGLKKWNRKLPSAMIVVVLGIVGIYLFMVNEADVNIVGYVPNGLPAFTLPNFTWEQLTLAFPLAMALAFIAFAEEMAIAKGVEERTQEYHTVPDQELKALGVSNIIGALFQSFSANASMSRTAVNVNEGAKTGLASIISALVVGLVLLFLTPYFQYLPKSILGAIILVAVFGLLDLKYPAQLYKHQKDELILLIVTFVTTLFVGIAQGIIFGVLFSLFLLIYRTSKPHVAVLGKIKGMDYFKNVERFSEDVECDNGILILRFDAQLFFANVQHFKTALYKQIHLKKGTLSYVILNAEPVNYIDNTAAAELEKIVIDLKEKGITFKLAGAIGPIRDILVKSGLVKVIGPDHIHVRTAEAYEDCLAHVGKSPMQNKVSMQYK